MKPLIAPVAEILKENDRRNEIIYAKFDPITGEGSVGERLRVEIPDFIIPVQWLPKSMMVVPFVRKLAKAGSIEGFLAGELGVEPNPEDASKVTTQLIRLRCRHDFPFWCATLVKVKKKGGGDDILFRLWLPQRKLVEMFEKSRLAGDPIRIIMLKARQWGGSTTTQLYMAWLQFLHRKGLNSLIIAHQGDASVEIKDMFDRMIAGYPVEMLHPLGESWSESEAKMVRVGKFGSIFRVPQRNCKIKLGSAESPDSCRGGDYNLVHLSEVGVWKKTDGKAPEDIVRSACSGILYKPYTMIVYESTANGTGNFFHSEYQAAAYPDPDAKVPSQFSALFIPWYEIEQYSIPFKSLKETIEFACSLWKGRQNQTAMSTREESGRYLWWLWEKGATLEAINWYVHERAGRNSHAVMASEYPSDDVEAFVHSGSMVFDKYLVKEFEKACSPPRFIGEIQSGQICGKSEGCAISPRIEMKENLRDLKFIPDSQGSLHIWAKPEIDPEVKVTNRYLVVVDIGGRSNKADWSVIAVFDRINMIDGDRQAIVAQWRGHCDIDRLAWRAAQIAAYYDNALLVIESNTLETRDRERQVEGGDQSQYILNQISKVYDNLYARRQSEDEIRQGLPRKYGFHTNIATKPMIITTLIKCVRDHLYTERDRQVLDEFLTYEKKQNGAYGAIAGKHDDLLMTRAIGLHISLHEMDLPKIIKLSEIRHKKRRGHVSEASI
ncbi:MAG: terminase [Muribaculaceae bacterium]|nr:terminase [Muribaculaceae bacterium]